MQNTSLRDQLQIPLLTYQGQFNAGEYFESHETLELVWLELKNASGLNDAEGCRRGLQGLIQLAAGMIKWREGNFRGASRLFSTALDKLESLENGILLSGNTHNALIEQVKNSLFAIQQGTPFQPFHLDLFDKTHRIGDATSGETSV